MGLLLGGGDRGSPCRRMLVVSSSSSSSSAMLVVVVVMVVWLCLVPQALLQEEEEQERCEVGEGQFSAAPVTTRGNYTPDTMDEMVLPQPGVLMKDYQVLESMLCSDAPVLMHAISSLGWENLVIFHDNSTDTVHVLDDLLPQLHAANLMTCQEDREPWSRVVVLPYQKMRSDFVPVYRHFLVLGTPGYVLDIFRQMSLVSQPNETNPFLFLTQWLTAVPQTHVQRLHTIVRLFENLAVLVPSDETPGALTLWTLRQVGNDSVLTVVTSLILWPFPPLTPREVFPNPLYGLGGRPLRVVVKELNIYSLVKRNESGSVNYIGVSVDLLEELALRANFTYTVFDAPDDGSFGQELSSGRWDGPIGQLRRKEMDLAVGYFSITTERTQVADALAPYYIEKAAIIFRQETLEPRPDYMSFFLHPFQTLVYVALSTSMLLVLLQLVLMECCWLLFDDGHGCGGGGGGGGRLGGGGGRSGGGGGGWGGGGGGGRRRRGLMRPWLWLDMVVSNMEVLLAGLLKQSLTSHYRVLCSATHVLVTSWWLFGLVLTSVYSSQLTSTLMVVPHSLPFTSMAQLIYEQDTFVWGVMGGSAMETMLQNTNIQVFKDYYTGVLNFAKTDSSVLSPSLDEHNERVLRGHYAHFVFFDTEIDKLLQKDCRVAKLPEPYVSTPFAFYVQKGCPYGSLLSLHIERIVAAGLVMEWRRKRLPPNPQCLPEQHDNLVIDLTDTQTAFYMAAAGLLLAALTLSLEHVHLICSQLGFRCRYPFYQPAAGRKAPFRQETPPRPQSPPDAATTARGFYYYYQ